MPNSKNKVWAKWLDRIAWLVGIVAKFMPANIKVMMVAFSTIAGGLVALLDRCDQTKNPPASPVPTVTVLPTTTVVPSPSPSPSPTPKPQPTLIAPERAKAGQKFKVELCHVGNLYNVSLYAEKYRLAYMGFGEPCMFIFIGLNGKGTRELIAILPDGLRVKTNVIVE